jgi:hypothetical protein
MEFGKEKPKTADKTFYIDPGHRASYSVKEKRYDEYFCVRGCGHGEWFQSPGVSDPNGLAAALFVAGHVNPRVDGLCNICNMRELKGYVSALGDRVELDRLSEKLKRYNDCTRYVG